MPLVKLYGNLRKLARSANGTGGGDRRIAHGLNISGDTVQAIIEGLCASSPELCAALLDQGVLRPYIRVIINGRDIELAQGLATPLDPQDQVDIFPPIAGGSLAGQTTAP